MDINTVLILAFGLAMLYIMQSRKSLSKEDIELSLHKNLKDLQGQVQSSVNSARSEMQQSKDQLQENTLKTIETMKDMGQILHKLSSQQQGAQDLAESLKYLLQSPKLRGNYGEEVLEEMLERILPKGIWQVQYRIEGREMVDAIVRFKDVLIPIDAKFPREDYDRYLAAELPEDKKRHWKAYEEALKRQIQKIEEKYIKPEQGTSEFAFMFIPSEAVYYETIAQTNFIGQNVAIYEYAQKHNVVPVSPNTFYAFLQVVLMGVRHLDVMKNAKQLQEGLKKIERDMGFLVQKYEDVGDKLEKAQKSFNVGQGHMSRLQKNLDAAIQMDLPTPEPEMEKIS